jgi:hypothetical protein
MKAVSRVHEGYPAILIIDDGIGAEAGAMQTLDLQTVCDRGWNDEAQHQKRNKTLHDTSPSGFNDQGSMVQFNRRPRWFHGLRYQSLTYDSV